MTLIDIVIILHIVGAAIGLGAATASDSLFLRSIRNRLISSDQFLLLRSAQQVVMAGLAIVVISGVALVVHDMELVTSAAFQAKMIIVTLLMLNGFVFHFAVNPYLERHRDQPLEEGSLRSRLWIFAISGPLSVVSWYGALVVGAKDEPVLALWVYLVVYAGLVVGGAMVAYLLLAHMLLAPLLPEGTPVPSAEPSKGKYPWSMFLLGGLLTLVLATLAVAALSVTAGI